MTMHLLSDYWPCHIDDVCLTSRLSANIVSVAFQQTLLSILLGNFMIIRQHRLNKGWSQLQLAELSGLSLRTVQRIEKGQKPTIESLKSIAAVFELDWSELVDKGTLHDIDEAQLTEAEMAELDHIREVKKFLRDCAIFALFAPIIIFMGLYFADNVMVIPAVVIWASILAWDAFDVFDAKDFFGQGWEKRQLEKRLGRKVD